MPWQLDGTFLRVNPDYDESASGELWGKDLKSTPSIKIIASRHDWHDHDLGQGIERCLNIDGLNAMYANLDLNFNKIINNIDGTGAGDAATWDQIPGTIDYTSIDSTLTLYNNAGDIIDTTIIVAAGGGATGVTSVDVVAGQLTATPAPIIGAGTIGLAETGITPQTYDGGIKSIQVDAYGRLTQVVGNYGSIAGDPDQTLGIIQTSTTNVFMTLSKSAGSGDSVQIMPVTTTRAGIMTASMYIDLLNAGSGGTGAIQDLSLGTIGQLTVGINISDGGADITLPAATPGVAFLGSAGLMTNADKAKTDSLLGGGGEGKVTPLQVSQTPTEAIITGHDGKNTDSRIDSWSENAGVMAGTVTNTAPVSTVGKPDGFIWFVY